MVLNNESIIFLLIIKICYKVMVMVMKNVYEIVLENV